MRTTNKDRAEHDVRCYLRRLAGSKMVRFHMLDKRAGQAIIIQASYPFMPPNVCVRKPPEPPIRPSGRLGRRIPLSSAPKSFLRELDRLEKAGELSRGLEEAMAGARLVLAFSGRACKNGQCPEERLTEAI